jgi:putative ubiquitin-RnfH superfamily antitoxin RatB of RatAB toxin-antitoxin module
MNPALIALIVGSIGQALEYSLKLTALVKEAEDMSDEEVAEKYRELIADYKAAREEWNNA